MSAWYDRNGRIRGHTDKSNFTGRQHNRPGMGKVSMRMIPGNDWMSPNGRKSRLLVQPFIVARALITTMLIKTMLITPVWLLAVLINAPETFGQPPVVSKISDANDQDASQPTSGAKAFDGNVAFSFLEQVCELGPRVSTSAGMKAQQDLIRKHFEGLGAQVALQRFQAMHPIERQPVELANLCVRFHPDRRKRLLLACHYDTRPFPDQDKVNPQGRFLGANDGASGVGLLMELGNHLAEMEGKYGFDIVFFDGEEFVWMRQRDPMFLGSTFFSENYAAGRWDTKYSLGILVDMVADKDLQIFYEGNSLDLAPRVTKSIWAVAGQLGVKEFVPRVEHRIRDDHLPLNTIAKIQTCDIIDFDYPNPELGNIYWHTEADVPENCSAESLQKVGDVLLEWLRQLQQL